ncbi:MAG: hydroxymethylbilane synthase [Flavobacteriaceae bacterium]
MSKTIRIGTRDSELALWQAHTVQQKLNDLGYKTDIIAVKSQGDLILDKPLYELGITGIFTKTLDVAMIKGEVDIAVHSMKDVPTALPQGIAQGAVLERAQVYDLLLFKDDSDFAHRPATIATGSLRRKAMWLNRHPNHTVTDLRGNVNTRLQKLQDNPWDGAIFAAAGLERINLKPENHQVLDWMTPAPAQGAMVVMAMAENSFTMDAVSELNDVETQVCTHIERQFLKTLEGGCTAPIGAYARIVNDETIIFKGDLLLADGSKKVSVEKQVPIEEWKKLGFYAAQEVLENGGAAIMEVLRQQLNTKS